MAMNFDTLAWAFVVVIAIHNFEEALFLPSWSNAAGRWHKPVNEFEFRFAVVILTLLAALFAVLAVQRNEIGIYLLCGYALAMALNVFLPHVAATIALRRYAPGTATALLFNLPVCVMLLVAAGREQLISWWTLCWSAPLLTVAIVGLIPILFQVGHSIGQRRAE